MDEEILTAKEMIAYLQARVVTVNSPRGSIYPHQLKELPYQTIRSLYDNVREREERFGMMVKGIY